MAYIRVAYKTKDIDFDCVPGNCLNTLIDQDEISHFFRPAEKRWVSVKFDAIRGEGGGEYQGPERRRNDSATRPAGQEAENSYLNEETSGKDWLERLWHRIENS